MSATGKVVVGCYLQLNEQPRQNGKTLPCARLLEERYQLRELVRVILSDMDAWQMVIANGDTGYGKGCLERLHDLRNRARELGIEVDE